jgi:CAAX protease family protein
MKSTSALLATIGLLGFADVARSAWVPGSAHLAFNLGLTAATAGIAVAAGLTADELGLRNVRAGLRWGGGAFAAVAGVVAAAALVAPGWSVFEDDRVEISTGELLRKVLFTIPVGTVLLEELAFRGSLLAQLRRITSTGPAVAASAVLFGLWHVPGAWKSAGDNAALADLAGSTSGRLGAVIGTVAATTVAGTGFAWLRLRSGSLIAPSLAHLATNSVVFTAAWVLAR